MVAEKPEESCIRMPKRIQRLATSKWKMPRKAIYVGKGSIWASPFEHGETAVRTPGSHGQAWEYAERTFSPLGEPSPYFHDTYINLADGSKHYEVTWHSTHQATRKQCAELYREYVTGQSIHLQGKHRSQVERIKTMLRGKDLVCWCPLTDERGSAVPCHADVLLEIANSDAMDKNLWETLGIKEAVSGLPLEAISTIPMKPKNLAGRMLKLGRKSRGRRVAQDAHS